MLRRSSCTTCSIAAVLAWLLLSAAFERGERHSGARMGTWTILDSFQTERECLAVAARVRQEAFSALEQIRQGKPVPAGVREYPEAPWPQTKPDRDFFIGRSRAGCEKD